MRRRLALPNVATWGDVARIETLAVKMNQAYRAAEDLNVIWAVLAAPRSLRSMCPSGCRLSMSMTVSQAPVFVPFSSHMLLRVSKRGQGPEGTSRLQSPDA